MMAFRLMISSFRASRLKPSRAALYEMFTVEKNPGSEESRIDSGRIEDILPSSLLAGKASGRSLFRSPTNIFSAGHFFHFLPYYKEDNNVMRFSVRYRFSTSSSPFKLIGTHDGVVSCNEALGCFLLTRTKKFLGARIWRTTNPKILQTLDAVVNVGGVYDPSRDRYDHRQEGFGEVFGHHFSTKLSAAGLVYKHYGLEVVANLLQLEEENPWVQHIYSNVYKNFVEVIDANDNGLPTYPEGASLTARVARLNFDWLCENGNHHEIFLHAVSLVGSEFTDFVRFRSNSILVAQSIRLATSSQGVMSSTIVCPKMGAVNFQTWKEQELSGCLWSQDPIQFTQDHGISLLSIGMFPADDVKQLYPSSYVSYLCCTKRGNASLRILN